MGLLDRSTDRGIVEAPSGTNSSNAERYLPPLRDSIAPRNSSSNVENVNRYVSTVRDSLAPRDIDNRSITQNLSDRYIAPVRESLAARTRSVIPFSDNNASQFPSYSDAIFNLFDTSGNSLAGGRKYDYPVAVYPGTEQSSGSGIILIAIIGIAVIAGYLYYKRG